MAWYNSGNWEGISRKEFPLVLRDLCWAVNEREKFLGRGDKDDTWTPWYIAGVNPSSGDYDLTQFTVTSGTKAFPVASDWDGLAFGFNDWYNDLMDELKAAIVRLRSFYGRTRTNSNGLAGVYSFYQARHVKDDFSVLSNDAAVISLAGLGSSWLSQAYINDPSLWIQMQLVMDELKHVEYDWDMGLPATTLPNVTDDSREGGSYLASPPATQEARDRNCYDEAYALTPASKSNHSRVGWSLLGASVPPLGRLYGDLEFSIPTQCAHGTLEETHLIYTQVSRHVTVTFDADLPSIGTVTNPTAGGTTTTTNNDDTVTDWPTIGTQTDVTISCDAAPASALAPDSPFDWGAMTIFALQASQYIDISIAGTSTHTRSYTDISGELTYG